MVRKIAVALGLFALCAGAPNVSAQLLYQGQGTYSTYGNQTYGPGRSTFSTYGNTTYGPGGSTATTYGNQTYVTMPDGSTVVCSQYGNQTYCN